MLKSIEDYEPKEVFTFFNEISKIPRGSGNEKRISDFLRQFAQQRHLWVHQDEEYNLLIKKPGSVGREQQSAVILQGHLDMVCEKNNDTVHDFTKDPIIPYGEEDYVKAQGTTLGADNGIAIAYAMALLDAQQIDHPPLEIVLTTNEETGMYGARAFDGSLLEGKTLINLDHEEDGVFVSSCAGGQRIELKFKLPFEPVQNQAESFLIGVKGLKGGHSGMDIRLERGNANVLLVRLLNRLYHTFDFQVSNLRGGAQDNAIPREAEAVVTMIGSIDALEREVEAMRQTLQKEYKETDNGLEIFLRKIDSPPQAWETQSVKKVIAAVMAMPNGVQSQCVIDQKISDLVETSNNIGVIETAGEWITVVSALRSSVASRKQYMSEKIISIAQLAGAEVRIKGEYPAWEYNPESKIRKIASDIYIEMFGQSPTPQAIHAGLECGLFIEKASSIDAISFGPDIFDAHTPNERMSISSVRRTWDFLREVLKQLD